MWVIVSWVPVLVAIGILARLAHKWIANQESAQLAVLEILGVERCALRFKCSRCNERVVERQSVVRGDAEASVMCIERQRDRKGAEIADRGQ